MLLLLRSKKNAIAHEVGFALQKRLRLLAFSFLNAVAGEFYFDFQMPLREHFI
jgi:hypothetical protein